LLKLAPLPETIFGIGGDGDAGDGTQLKRWEVAFD